MTLSPIQHIIEDLRQGKMVVLVDEEDRPHEALVAAAARVNREAYIIASRHRR